LAEGTLHIIKMKDYQAVQHGVTLFTAAAASNLLDPETPLVRRDKAPDLEAMTAAMMSK
jgi:hypothetical protein